MKGEQMKRIFLSTALVLGLTACANYNDYKGTENERSVHCTSNFKLWRACTYSANFSHRTLPEMMLTHDGLTKQYRPVASIDNVSCDCDPKDPDTVVFTVKANINHGAPKHVMPQTVSVPFFITAGDHKGDNVYDRQIFNLMFDMGQKATPQTFKLRFNTKDLNARMIKNYTLWGGMLYTRDDLDRDYSDKKAEIKELVEPYIDSKTKNINLPNPGVAG